MSEEVKEEKTVEEVKVEENVMEHVIHTDDEEIVAPKSLFDAACHYGHRDSNWNPKMRQYIYGIKNHLHIIDLNKTAKAVSDAYRALKKIVLQNGKVLFVGTKPTAKLAIQEEAIRSGSFYVARRWLGGTLTNFSVIYKRIQLLKTLEAQQSQGLFDVLPKKEAAEKIKLKEKLAMNLEGLKEIRKVPEAIVIVDPRVEHNAILEARLLHIPVFALADTNTDPDLIDYLIPCNDDSETASRLIIGLLADAVVEGKGGDPIYAYKSAEQTSAKMDEMLKGVDAAEQSRIIRGKIRTDILLSRKKRKLTSQDKKKMQKREQQQSSDGENSQNQGYGQRNNFNRNRNAQSKVEVKKESVESTSSVEEKKEEVK